MVYTNELVGTVMKRLSRSRLRQKREASYGVYAIPRPYGEDNKYTTD